jgi:hypothetical protein
MSKFSRMMMEIVSGYNSCYEMNMPEKIGVPTLLRVWIT